MPLSCVSIRDLPSVRERIRRRHCACKYWMHCALSGRTVIDYGSGSGILGIAALKLGAAHVIAVDIDPQALAATRENAIRNEVSPKLEDTCAGRGARKVPELRPADCVIANILAGPLIELAPTFDGGMLTEGRFDLVGDTQDAGLCGKGRIYVCF